MTDKQKLEALLREFGVEFSEVTVTREDRTEGVAVRCMDGRRKVTGYVGFYTDFVFGDNGRFLDMGAWE